jgi:hypothetical protein
MKNAWGGAQRLLFVAALAAAAWGCSTTKLNGTLVPNLRPQVELTARPQPGDSVYFKVNLQWTGSDPDGRVDYFIYAIDPPMMGDTTWTRINQYGTIIFFKSSTPNPAQTQPGPNGQFPATPVTSQDYHEFVIKAVDNEGAFSAPASVSFSSRTVAPLTQITSPSNGSLVTRTTPPSVRIEWRGTDPDREGVGVAGPPRLYKIKLVSQATIQQALGLGGSPPNAQNIQDFFSRDAPNFASWDSLSADTTFKQYEGVTPGQIWFFAVVSFDIAGAYEPRFNLNNNVLRFKPSTELQAPAIEVFNSFFQRSQGARGSFDLSESRVVHLEVPEGQPIPMNWDNANLSVGTVAAGFRWVLDPIDGDIFNETPRDNDSQTYRWSSWSLTEQSTVLGPFYQITTVNGKPDTTVFHRFYIESRDNTGATSIMVIQLEVVKAAFKDPKLARNILFFNDYLGDPDRADHQPYSNFPIASALDTLFYARGGFPYIGMPAGTLSKPGVFSGYFSDPQGNIVSDTVNYRFFPTNGLPLSVLTRYRAVVWYTSNKDAGRIGTKNGPSPEAALRFINDPGQLNTLAVYLAQGGKAFLFGSGILECIAAGYVARFGSNGAPASYPYRTSDSKPDRLHILWPGNFMWDYMKIRNGVDIADQGGAGDILSIQDNYGDFIPYLPQFMCPGAPWPPDGWTGQRTATCDPRVGPSSVNNLPTWDGLPIIPMQTEFNNWPTLPPQSIVCDYVSLANSIPASEAEFDTLYLGRCLSQRIRAAADWPDGKPVWFHVTDHTGAGYELDWTAIPLWYLDRTQLEIAVGKVLGKFGFQKNTNPLTQTGPGAVDAQATDFAGRPIE